jgi:predicted dehydrogenase
MTDLRFAVIGLGYWGPKIVRNLEALPHTQVAIVADLDAYRLASFSASKPSIKTTTRVEDVFLSDVDGVVIATPVRTHYQLAKKTLLHGKHVLHDVSILLDIGFADGMTAHIQISWLYPSKIRRVTVIGDKRMVVSDDTNPAEMLKVSNKGVDVYADPEVSYRFGATTIPHIDWIEPLRLECEDFVNAICTGTQPRAHGGVGLEVVWVLAAVQKVLDVQERGVEGEVVNKTSAIKYKLPLELS